REIAQLLGLVAIFGRLLVDLLADLPEQALGGGAVFEIEVAEVEERGRLLLFLHRVVETLEAAEARLVLEKNLQVGDDLVLLGGYRRALDRLALRDALEHLDNEHRVRRGDRAAALGNDVGMIHADRVADLADVEDDVA